VISSNPGELNSSPGEIRTLPSVETSPEYPLFFIDDFMGFNQIPDYILTSMILSSLHKTLLHACVHAYRTKLRGYENEVHMALGVEDRGQGKGERDRGKVQ